MLYMVEVTWGERIGVVVDRWEKARKGRNRTALFAAVAELSGVTRNSVSKYLLRLEPPSRHPDCQRAVLLLLALGEDPTDYGLSEEILPRNITADVIADTLAAHNATWRSASHRGARDHFHEAA